MIIMYPILWFTLVEKGMFFSNRSISIIGSCSLLNYANFYLVVNMLVLTTYYFSQWSQHPTLVPYIKLNNVGIELREKMMEMVSKEENILHH